MWCWLPDHSIGIGRIPVSFLPGHGLNKQGGKDQRASVSAQLHSALV